MSKLENECHTSSSSSFPSKKNLSFLQPFTAFLFKGRKTVEALQSHGGMKSGSIYSSADTNFSIADFYTTQIH